MNKLILALALAPALFTTGALAQTVSEDVTKELWCGTALVVAFGNAPSDATSEQLAQAQTYIDAGNGMIDEATQKHLDAGFTEEQLTKVKTDLVAEITPIVTGDGSNAKYSFEDCAALLPSGASSAPADTSSAPAEASSSSSAM
jgi:hypothetical protein